METLDVLIATCTRKTALSMTLTSLIGQTVPRFRVVVSDQTEGDDPLESGEVQAAVRVLRATGRKVELHKHLPRRGMAEQRQFLLDRAEAPYALFLDDDVLLEPDVAERMLCVISSEACGFVGCALIGASYLEDFRPHEQALEPWNGRVEPEKVEPGSPAWDRYKLHNAANVWHVQRGMSEAPWPGVRYKVAWVGGCVLYDRHALRECGGYGFWPALPAEHSGEDVVAQLRVMERYGGCGLLPSGAYHMELPTTVERRDVDAAKLLIARQAGAEEAR